MKNILARGGIEFLAVLLGLSGSLTLEDKRQKDELNSKLKQDYIKILEDVTLDIDAINEVISKNNIVFKRVEKLIEYSNGNIPYNQDSIITNLRFVGSPTLYGRQTAYKASVSSGRFNSSDKINITNEISFLYEYEYTRITKNSDRYDQRQQQLRDEYTVKFMAAQNPEANVDPSYIRNSFFNMDLKNRLYAHKNSISFYLRRLYEVKDQMIITKKLISDFLKNWFKPKRGCQIYSN